MSETRTMVTSTQTETKSKLEFKQHFLTRQWRWKLTAANNKIVAASTESFFNYKDCVHNAKLTRVGLNDLLDTYLV